MRHRGLRRGAFLGEMVVGHKNSKVMKPPLRVNNENICKTRGYGGERECVKTFCIKVFVNTFYFFQKMEFF